MEEQDLVHKGHEESLSKGRDLLFFVNCKLLYVFGVIEL